MKNNSLLRRSAQQLIQANLELIWPTRCALCNKPGAVLCDSCLRNLPYIDQWRACPNCGEPFGLHQCTHCNNTMLKAHNRTCLPYFQARSVVNFTAATGRIVRIYKNQGEQRLATILAQSMINVVPPEWSFDFVTNIPASKKALINRGFDHGAILAKEIAWRLQVPYLDTIAHPVTKDQRDLSRKDRIQNLQGSFNSLFSTFNEKSFLLIDDVYTTGATLCAASDALLYANAKTIFCLTFARA